MKFLFLMDPLEKVIYEKDTTFVMMLAAQRKGHEVYFLPDGGISKVEGKYFFYVHHVTAQDNKKEPFVVQEAKQLSESQVNAIFVRSDPPFDRQYLINTWMLDQAPEHILVINKPSGIRTVNEKIWASQFVDLVPPTYIGRNKKLMWEFLMKYKTVVAKPTDGHGGKSIFVIKEDDVNTNVILEDLTKHFSKEIILQKYLPEAQKGDKRILLLDGKVIGAVLRVATKNDHRNNFFAGGKPVAATITRRDEEIVERLNPHLRNLGLYFVGIDIMGDYLIEVNVTSPTCVQEINRLENVRLEDKIIEFVENIVDRQKSVDRISV